MGALADNPPQEPARRYSLPNGEVWERTGSCSRCGLCCTISCDRSALFFPPEAAAAPDGYCPAFVWDNVEHTAGYCDLRCGTYYAEHCADYPLPHHAATLPGCTYVWTRIA